MKRFKGEDEAESSLASQNRKKIKIPPDNTFGDQDENLDIVTSTDLSRMDLNEMNPVGDLAFPFPIIGDILDENRSNEIMEPNPSLVHLFTVDLGTRLKEDIEAVQEVIPCCIETVKVSRPDSFFRAHNTTTRSYEIPWSKGTATFREALREKDQFFVHNDWRRNLGGGRQSLTCWEKATFNYGLKMTMEFKDGRRVPIDWEAPFPLYDFEGATSCLKDYEEILFDCFQNDFSEIDSDLRALKAFLWKHNGKCRLSFYWDSQVKLENPSFPFGNAWTDVISWRTKNQMDWLYCIENQLTEMPTDIPDTSKESETHVDKSLFNLTLRDYQARTLTWMLRMEKNPGIISNSRKIGDYYLNMYSGEIETEEPRQAITGGILADETGVGKTVTMLALMRQNPPDASSNCKVPALVLCPANLIQQWKDEAKKCFGESCNVLSFTTVSEARSYSKKCLENCDFILISHAFLANRNYAKSQPGPIKPFQILYQRVIIDEIHELVDVFNGVTHGDRVTIKKQLKRIKALHWWGMTGTPKYHDPNNVMMAAQLLNAEIHPTIQNAVDFVATFVRRNRPNLSLPPMTTTESWIQLGPAERAIYQTLSNDIKSALLLCSHFNATQFAGQSSNDTSENLITVDQVANHFQNDREQQILHLDDQIEETNQKIEDVDPSLKSANDKIRSLKGIVSNLEQQRRKIQGELNFFENVVRMLSNRDTETCCVCFGEFESDQPVALTRCGHIFCCECMDRLKQYGNTCASCRQLIPEKSIYIVQPVDKISAENEFADETQQAIDLSRFGTKIERIARYILDIFAKNPEARFILFVQFAHLAKLISSALNDLNISNVYVMGNILKRSKAIAKFKSNECKVIMLNAESSVSGLNLTEATHVILLHPFYYGEGNEDKSIANEKQGIARAYRSGLTHELTVVRFLAQNTVEQDLYAQLQFFDRKE